jgi:hypothetical protein
VAETEWFTPHGSKELFHTYDKSQDTGYSDNQITAGKQFNIKLKTARITKNYDEELSLGDGKDNDLLILSNTHLEGQPKIQRIHYYENNVERGKLLDDFPSEVVFSCNSYQEGTLFFGIEILEIDDLDSDQRSKLKGFFQETAINKASQVFPIIFPYVKVGAKVAGGLWQLFGKPNQKPYAGVLEEDVCLYASGRITANTNSEESPLRYGKYTLVNKAIDGSQYELDRYKLQLKSEPDKIEKDLAYAVLSLDEGTASSEDFETPTRVAMLLAEINGNDSERVSSSIDYFGKKLEPYWNFKDLETYLNLLERERSREVLSPQETKLKEEISRRPALQRFLSFLPERPSDRP